MITNSRRLRSTGRWLLQAGAPYATNPRRRSSDRKALTQAGVPYDYQFAPASVDRQVFAAFFRATQSANFRILCKFCSCPAQAGVPYATNTRRPAAGATSALYLHTSCRDSLRITSCAPPSTMDVDDTRVSFAFSWSSEMVSEPQLQNVERILASVWRTPSDSVPA